MPDCTETDFVLVLSAAVLVLDLVFRSSNLWCAQYETARIGRVVGRH